METFLTFYGSKEGDSSEEEHQAASLKQFTDELIRMGTGCGVISRDCAGNGERKATLESEVFDEMVLQIVTLALDEGVFRQ